MFAVGLVLAVAFARFSGRGTFSLVTFEKFVTISMTENLMMILMGIWMPLKPFVF